MRSTRDYLRILKVRSPTIVVVTLIAVAMGIAYSALKTKTYSATSVVQFQQQTDIGVLDPGVSTPVDVNPTQSASADSQTVTRASVLAAVKRSTRTTLSTTQLQDAVNASVEPTSNLIDIQVTTKHAAQSAQLANAFAAQTLAAAQVDTRNSYAEEARSLQSQLVTTLTTAPKSTRSIYRQAIARLDILSQVADPVTVVRSATVPSKPASPKPAEDIGLALFLGLIAGLAAAFARDAFDLRLTDAASVEEQLGLHVVGQVPKRSLGLSTKTQAKAGSSLDHLENFRVVRTNVAFLAQSSSFKSVAVTSAVAEEGKSTISLWYAYVNAASGTRTLLVDADLRRPSLADRAGLKPTPGLTDYLVGDAGPEDILQSIHVEGPEAVPLTVITAGGHSNLPGETIGSGRFRRFVEEVTAVYDLVIFDTAPLLPVSDTLQLVPQVDLVLLCVRVGRTTRGQALGAKHALDNLPPRPTGAIVSGVSESRRAYQYYGYGQPYGQSASGEADKHGAPSAD